MKISLLKARNLISFSQRTILNKSGQSPNTDRKSFFDLNQSQKNDSSKDKEKSKDSDAQDQGDKNKSGGFMRDHEKSSYKSFEQRLDQKSQQSFSKCLFKDIEKEKAAQRELSNDIDLFSDKMPPTEHVLAGLDGNTHLFQGLKWFKDNEEKTYAQSQDKKL
ncbi:UNKNOWN [Stylonychia lemnae]|uniref:Uncharacterized protein n=1 Tax=Stylonychia lemnae TaxID=5949 RepID=A0A077ZX26_STYLE|nr:UNKNOWN [Stylonychia lemnae]|eukprot:CDW74440.1 UNKNOWN [Stylonychia lemnae]